MKQDILTNDGVGMSELIRVVERNLFTATDSICYDRLTLITEAHQRHESEPPVMRRALAFKHLLEHMTLDLTWNPVLAGNTSSRPRAWMLYPEFTEPVDYMAAIEHEDLLGFTDGKIPPDIEAYWAQPGKRMQGVGGLGHLSIDFDRVVNVGLLAILSELDRRKDVGTEKQQTFRRAMRISCEAVIAWANRYADAAEQAAETADDPVLASCHRRVAKACRHVPAHPARDFFEGVQAILLVHLATILEGQGPSLSIGLPDRALRRFADEVADYPEESGRIISAFLLGVASNGNQGRATNTQAITIGGRQADGTDACNAITRVFLEAFEQTPVSDPHLFLRWHPHIDTTSWDIAARMLSAGRSMPLLINDEQVVPGMLEADFAPEDAWDYCIAGCNELAVPGRACQCALSLQMMLNELKIFDTASRDVADEAQCTQDLLDAYERAVETTAERTFLKRLDTINLWADQVPFVFTSAFCHESIEKGDDLLRAMPYPDRYALYTHGMANVVNALAAIQQEVFEKNHYTLSEFYKAIDARDATVLARIASAPKWANDDDDADRWAIALNETRDSALRRVAQRNKVHPFFVCHVVRSWHHLHGRDLGNTADGRAARTPFGESIGAVFGTATQGPTGILNSVLKLDARRWFNGIYNLNLSLPAGGATTPELIRATADVFFRNGGQELQIGVLDAKRLREAKAHPDQHRDLVVRIAGLNARFVDLTHTEQDEIIQRAEAL